MQFWNELEGQVVDGYPLRRLVRSEGRTAWFDTETPEGAATISLTESLTDTEEVTERLQAAQQLKHPNLVAISRVGHASIDATLFVYAVMEHTDQDLSDVLRGQALSKEEVRQVAEALVGALTAIHNQGLVHGRVEPASVLAIGDAVKLRSDCLQSPGGTRAGDVAGIGATLFQAFTQSKASSADDAQINRAPAPFAEIMRNSLSSRWNLAQIAAVLKPGSVAVAPPTASPGAPAPTARPSTPAAPAAVTAPATPKAIPAQGPAQTPATANATKERTTAAAVSATAPQKAAPTRNLLLEDEPSPRRPVALYAIAAVAVLILLGWFIFRPKAGPAPAASSPRISNPAVSSSPAPAPVPPERLGPGRTKEKPSAAMVAPAKPAAPAKGSGARSIWRVVVYTYRRKDQAQGAVDEINRVHPGLGASVFAERGGSGPFLVTLGGPMDRDQAFKVRDRARGMGLPSDTYAQNFPE
ncbi:MAG TPA: hypothetical protein VGR96_19820 [Acidobacteriaceae bacterium]|nr:hypothetical protein [Acidobacteriaceae bacterium]